MTHSHKDFGQTHKFMNRFNRNDLLGKRYSRVLYDIEVIEVFLHRVKGQGVIFLK